MAPPLDETQTQDRLLQRAELNLRTRRMAGAEQLQIAWEWAMTHRQQKFEAHDVRDLGAASVAVWEFAPAELALVMEVHPQAAQKLMADAIDLDDRLPHTWAAIQSGRLEAWVGRKIAALTRVLSAADARLVDEQICDALGTLSPGRLLSLVEGRVVAADPPLADRLATQARTRRLVHRSRSSEHGTASIFARLDAGDAQRLYATTDHLAHLLADANGDQPVETMDQLRARALGLLADPQAALDLLAGRDPRRGRAVVYVHLSDDFTAARVEEIGPMTRSMLRDLLGHDHITLKPVIDLNESISSDSYEVPAALAERLHLARPADVFPWAESLSRRLDLDHTVPWPAGETGLDNLGKLTRRHHRIKTHGGWQVHQRNGRFVWTSPHGRTVTVDQGGTHRGPPRLDVFWPQAA